MKVISADKIIDELGITNPDEIDLEAIAYYFGATIKYCPLPSCDARLLGIGDKAIITINSAASLVRQRFSIGHELGHWLRDQGKKLYFCKKENIGLEFRNIPIAEKKANDFASDLLLPKNLFLPIVNRREITIRTALEISNSFQASATATALRLVQMGSFPSMFISFNRNGKRWFKRHPDLPEEFWPNEELHHESIAFELLFKSNNIGANNSAKVEANIWIDRKDAQNYEVIESSMKVSEDSVITLIWWKNEAQIIDL